MLPKNLPLCVCGASDSYRPGGGHFGPNGSSQWFTCEGCGRSVVAVSHHMTVLAFPTERVAEFPEEGFNYINGPLDVTLRAYGAAVEEVRKVAWDAQHGLDCDLLGLPRGTKVDFGGEPRGRCLKRPDGNVVEDAGKLKQLDAWWDARRHRPSRDLLAPPTPPQVPACLTLYVLGSEGWCLVDREESAALSVPPDPRRVAHDTFFKDLFARVRFVRSIEPREIPNQYCKDRNNSEPWYEFENGGKKFTVGPRKRVINITVEAEEPFPTEELRALAERDGVTYEADGGWQSKAESATKVTIHAWGGDKFVEYLVAALGAV